MNTDPRPRALAVLPAVFFAFTAAAAALTIDLANTREGQAVSLDVSRTDANRIEFPETVINAFSANGAMDVKIIGRSVLIRTEEAAELIILTEKRRLTLLLSPEEGPSRTAIMRDGAAQSPAPPADAPQGPGALPYERVITDLVVSLAQGGGGEVEESERKLSRSLRITRRAEASSPPFLATLYVARNPGSAAAPLKESMFLSHPRTVAVGMERDRLLPGEKARIFVVTKKEPPR